MLESEAALQMADEIRQDRKQAETMLLNYTEELKTYRLKREEYVRGRQRLCVASNLTRRILPTHGCGRWSLLSEGCQSASGYSLTHDVRHHATRQAEDAGHGSCARR